MGKCGCFFLRDNSFISRGKSHISRVRGLVVRCLLFNPEVSCSDPWVCAYFLTSIPKQKVLFFRHYGLLNVLGTMQLTGDHQKYFRFFFQFSVFKGFSLRKMGFLLFSVGGEWFSRLMRILSGIFWLCIL